MSSIFRSSHLAHLGAPAVLVLVPAVVGAVFLANNAPRDWSLHWERAQVLLASASENRFAAAATSRGFDVLWTTPAGQLVLSQFNSAGRRLGPDVSLRGQPQETTLAPAGDSAVAVWHEDYNGGSRLRAAIVKSNGHVSYYTLASGSWPLEHPDAFADGSQVGAVFSWQRTGLYQVFLSVIGRRGVSSPAQLTRVAEYAFYPRAVADANGVIQLAYLDLCCGGYMRLTLARFTPHGRPLGSRHVLDVMPTGLTSSNAVPEVWALDLLRQHRRVWIGWAGSSGLSVAAVDVSGRVVSRPSDAVPLGNTDQLTLAVAGSHHALIWNQTYDLGTYLGTTPVDATRSAAGSLDRVAYESAQTSSPIALAPGRNLFVLYLANPARTDRYQIEMSRFSARTLSPPSVWARFGLGLGNPIGNLAILLLGALALGLLITMANILIVGALFLVYFLVSRTAGGWKWHLYALLLSVALYLLVVQPGLPSPPLLFLTTLPSLSGVLAVAGGAIFLFVLSRALLRRVDDVYRAALMAFVAIYFVAFIQALTAVEGVVSKI